MAESIFSGTTNIDLDLGFGQNVNQGSGDLNNSNVGGNANAAKHKQMYFIVAGLFAAMVITLWLTAKRR